MLKIGQNQVSPFTVSILKNTNKILSSSQDNLAGIKPGSYIKLGGTDILYQISETKQIIIFKDFELIDNRTIKINSNTNVDFQKEDIIEIMYDEYELNSVISIVKPGRFYQNEEIITIKDGEPSVNVMDGIPYPTKLKIDEVDDNGGIVRLELNQNGKYIVPPHNNCNVISKYGTDALLKLKYKIIDNHETLSKVIKNISFNNNETILELNYSLPSGIKNGKISCKKYEIYLTNLYLGDTLFNVNYEIFKDFTPYLKLPLMLKNSSCPEILFNDALIKIDKEIQELKKIIKEKTWQMKKCKYNRI